MNKLFLLVLACALWVGAWAQDSTNNASLYQKKDKKSQKKDRINRMMRMEEEGELVFNKHNIFGIRLATDGYGISFEKGKYKTNTRTFIYSFELNEKKSQKEHKLAAASYNGIDINSFIVGKLNNFYQFKLAIGQQHLLGGKGNKNGVAVTALYTGGLSLGILKPYLFNVPDSLGNIQKMTYSDLFQQGLEQDISGSAGFTSGWGQVKFKPGINAKIAMRFDYGRFNQTISAIEAGLTGEFYFSKIPQVYLVNQKQFFFNGYVAILFGGRK